MAKSQPASAAATPAPPQLYAAQLAPGGDVLRGIPITQKEAIGRRQHGEDVVVCGDDLAANRAVAQVIEQAANGAYKRCPPHASAGPHALPHYQPISRPPEGHTFYETPHRKAK